jgi:hypothetical protein
MKGGLTTTIDDLKQLLLGTLLWSPLTFMQVGGVLAMQTQNLKKTPTPRTYSLGLPDVLSSRHALLETPFVATGQDVCVCYVCMQVGTHHLVNGDLLQPDPDHSIKTVAGIDLTPEQEDVLVIIGGGQTGLYEGWRGGGRKGRGWGSRGRGLGQGEKKCWKVEVAGRRVGGCEGIQGRGTEECIDGVGGWASCTRAYANFKLKP